MAITDLIFRPEDRPVLTYLEDDGVQVEPEFYVPIIPMVLVNGAAGIGTGFSTNVPCYNPLVILRTLKSGDLAAFDTLQVRGMDNIIMGTAIMSVMLFRMRRNIISLTTTKKP